MKDKNKKNSFRNFALFAGSCAVSYVATKTLLNGMQALQNGMEQTDEDAANAKYDTSMYANTILR